jgi:hypothetical protein
METYLISSFECVTTESPRSSDELLIHQQIEGEDKEQNLLYTISEMIQKPRFAIKLKTKKRRKTKSK